MKITLSLHAKEQSMARHISLEDIELAIKTPDSVLPSFRNRILYRKNIGDKILEVVAIKEKQILTIITQYYLE